MSNQRSPKFAELGVDDCATYWPTKEANEAAALVALVDAPDSELAEAVAEFALAVALLAALVAEVAALPALVAALAVDPYSVSI